MTIPTVHLNGTPKQRLCDAYEHAWAEVENAILAVCNAGPNARDYYVQGPAAFPAAADEHQARLEKLRAVAAELEHLLIAVADQAA